MIKYIDTNVYLLENQEDWESYKNMLDSNCDNAYKKNKHEVSRDTDYTQFPYMVISTFHESTDYSRACYSHQFIPLDIIRNAAG